MANEAITTLDWVVLAAAAAGDVTMVVGSSLSLFN